MNDNKKNITLEELKGIADYQRCREIFAYLFKNIPRIGGENPEEYSILIKETKKDDKIIPPILESKNIQQIAANLSFATSTTSKRLKDLEKVNIIHIQDVTLRKNGRNLRYKWSYIRRTKEARIFEKIIRENYNELEGY